MNKRLLRFAGAALLFSLLPGVARADAASDLLAKHKAFVGWQFGDGTIRSVTYKEVRTDSKNAVLDTAQVRKYSALYRAVHTDSKGLVTNEGFTGRLFWTSNENGFTQPVLGESQRYLIARDTLFNEATTLASANPEHRGAQSIDGQSVEIIRISTPGDPIDLYIDPQTGAYKRAVIDPGGDLEQTIDILGYTDVLPAKKMISKWKYHDSEATHELSAFAANANVPLADLHPPAQTATWKFANDQPFKITVTDERVYIDATINGVAGRFIVDTGASQIALTQAFADKVHMKPIENSSSYGIGGSVKTRIGKVDSITVGGNTLSNVIVTSLDIHLDDKAPDGLMGFDLFGGAIIALDTDAQTMKISDPAKSQVDKSQGYVATVDLSDGTPTFPMKINNSITVNATMDSGNTYYVLFGHDLITKYGLRMLVDNSLIGFLHSHIGLGGVGGYDIGGCGHLDAVALGPIVYQNAPACETSSFGGHQALLGFDFFKNFNFIFDYPEATLVFLPHQ